MSSVDRILFTVVLSICLIGTVSLSYLATKDRDTGHAILFMLMDHVVFAVLLITLMKG